MTKISEFIELLKALKVSKRRIAKYILHLKMIRENLGLPFEEATRKDIEHFVASWLYDQGYSAEITADYVMVLKCFYKFLRSGNVDKETPRRGQMAQEDNQAKREKETRVPHPKGSGKANCSCRYNHRQVHISVQFDGVSFWFHFFG